MNRARRGAPLRPARLAPLPLALALACAGRPAEAPRPPPPRVVVETAAGGRHAVTVELARTEAEQDRGLMYRRELAEDAGMLFIFAEAAPRTFWMKNTLIPLDMLFIDDAGVVAGLVRQAQPLTLTPRGPGPGIRARFVLEVAGGWAARHGVEAGARVRLENVPRY